MELLKTNLRTGESAPVQAARMFIVPITLFSCASRAEAASESTTRRVSITVSISAARTIRCEQRVLVRDLDELGPLELARRLARVDADDRLDLVEALERLREPPAPVGRQAGDEHPLRLPAARRRCSRSHPNHTAPRFATISWRFSWIRRPDLLRDGLDQRLVVDGVRAAELGRVDRLEEAELELRRQVPQHPERPEPREGRA